MTAMIRATIAIVRVFMRAPRASTVSSLRARLIAIVLVATGARNSTRGRGTPGGYGPHHGNRPGAVRLPPAQDDYLRRLRCIEGQARGLQRMVEDEQYCIDIVTQVSAMTKALQSVALGLVEEHLSHCVVDAARSGGPEADDKVARRPTRSPAWSAPEAHRPVCAAQRGVPHRSADNFWRLPTGVVLQVEQGEVDLE